MKANDMIKVHLYGTDNKEIKTRNFDKVFKVYEKNGRLGIDWNIEKSPYTCKGDVFTPFETFASTVIFENVETGELFNFSNIKNGIEKRKATERLKKVVNMSKQEQFSKFVAEELNKNFWTNAVIYQDDVFENAEHIKISFKRNHKELYKKVLAKVIELDLIVVSTDLSNYSTVIRFEK